jgi:hypothetical protein
VVSSLEIACRWDSDVPVLRLSGDLDLRGTTSVMAQTVAMATAGALSIVCDVHALNEPHSSHLLTVFPAAQGRIGTWPQRAIHLAGASPAVAARLTKLRIDRFMSVHPTLNGALAAAHQDDHTVYRAIRLPPVQTSPAEARRYLDPVIAAAAAPEVHDITRIVVSELTTNVVRHVQRPFTLGLALSPSGLLVAVTDSSRQEPILRPVRTAATDGRGIQLVAALSQSWGVRLVHEKGKTVWARIATTSA